MRYPTKAAIVALHDRLVAEYGGESGLFNPETLDAAWAAPLQGFGDQDLFPSVEAKAARLGYGLISNHAFFDGNKRIGAHMLLHVLAMNDAAIHPSADALYDLAMAVARGELAYEDVLAWIEECDLESSH